MSEELGINETTEPVVSVPKTEPAKAAKSNAFPSGSGNTTASTPAVSEAPAKKYTAHELLEMRRAQRAQQGDAGKPKAPKK